MCQIMILFIAMVVISCSLGTDKKKKGGIAEIVSGAGKDTITVIKRKMMDDCASPFFYFTHGVASSTYTQPTIFFSSFPSYNCFSFSFLSLFLFYGFFCKKKKLVSFVSRKFVRRAMFEKRQLSRENGSSISFFFSNFLQTDTDTLTQSQPPFLPLSQPKNFVLEAVPTDQIFIYINIYISWEVSQSCNIPSLLYLRILQTTTITYKLYYSIFSHTIQCTRKQLHFIASLYCFQPFFILLGQTQ